MLSVSQSIAIMIQTTSTTCSHDPNLLGQFQGAALA
jgi:hypothetical protein